MDETSSKSPTMDDQIAPKKGKRKPHRKSRTGCKQCRASRVKCDEKKPACSYCIRHSESCSFLATELVLAPSISNIGLITRTLSPATRAPNSSSPSQLCSNLHMQELELLHHYTTSTAQTLSQGPASLPAWAEGIPKVALEHPFIMHGIFAISCLHLSHLRPSRRQEYALLSAHHENLALPIFRSTASAVTEENCVAVFAFSALVVVYAMASPDQPGPLFAPTGNTDGLPEWLHLLRGLGGLLRPARHWIEDTLMAPMLQREPYGEASIHPSDDLHLSALSSLFVDSPDHGPERSEELRVYRETLEILRNCFMVPVQGNLPKTPMPYNWFVFVSDRYIRLLGEGKAEALVLMAYECVLMKRLEPCWIVDGLAGNLMGYVYRNLSGDWRFWIEWPLQEVGTGT